ncbi:MAG: FKBP-type peptidyl-prolyl cis-trans isomerase [Dehalococcoidia bacterium]
MTIRLVLLPGTIVILALAAAGCSGGAKGPPSTATPRPNPTIVAMPTVTGTTQTLADGLKYIDLQAGTGATPSKGQRVSVDYAMYTVGRWVGGTTGTPFSFILGRREVIAGMDEGIATMRVGGKRRLLIPAALAYGSAGLGDPAGVAVVVPPNQPVVVDVTLLSAK